MKRAFSLLEVMISLGIVAMLAGSVFAFMLDLLRGRESLSNATIDAVASATLIERLESDLLVGITSVGADAGISGDESSIRVRGRAVRLPLAGDEAIGDLTGCKISYDEAGWRLVGSRLDADTETISERVRACRFRYFDGRRWVSSFDSSTTGTIPVAIEIALWFDDPPAPEEPMSLEDQSDQPGRVPDMSAPEDIGFADGAFEDMLAETPELPLREPDLLRVMIVPDGPIAGWSDAP